MCNWWEFQSNIYSAGLLNVVVSACCWSLVIICIKEVDRPGHYMLLGVNSSATFWEGP